MKTLILARHAKSSWDHPGISDFERPLNTRGENDAPAMAALLKQLQANLQLIISSDAARALATAEVYANTLGLTVERSHALYLACSEDIIYHARQVRCEVSSVMLVGHNPGMTDALEMLCHASISNMPTCSFAIIQFDCDQWSEIDAAHARLIQFEYPSKYR